MDNATRFGLQLLFVAGFLLILLFASLFLVHWKKWQYEKRIRSKQKDLESLAQGMAQALENGEKHTNGGKIGRNRLDSLRQLGLLPKNFGRTGQANEGNHLYHEGQGGEASSIMEASATMGASTSSAGSASGGPTVILHS